MARWIALGTLVGVIAGLAGAAFLEVQAVGRAKYDALVPCLTASVVGDLVVRGLGVSFVFSSHRGIYGTQRIPEPAASPSPGALETMVTLHEVASRRRPWLPPRA